MGALTAKPTAFNFRTWEVNSIKYISCQDSLVPNIRVDLFQKKIVRVLPLEDWISDNIRFLFLNLDKQTVKSPALVFKIKSNFILNKLKKVLRQHTYTVVMHYLSKKILKKRIKNLNLNLMFGSIFTKNFDLYQRLNKPKTNLNFLTKNSFLSFDKKPDVTKYSEIYLFNLNPRLDSPLLNLDLKDLENSQIKSIGNFQTSFEVKSNNLKSLLNLGSKSLLLFSETLKNNEFLNSLSNKKFNLSPVYLNVPNVINHLDLNLEPNESLNFNLGLTENLNLKQKFSVKISTHIDDLNFDIYLPITNYFVSSGEIISIKGAQKLKMIRPSFNLKDHILSLSLILNNGKTKSKLDSTKIYNYSQKKTLFWVKNRLSYFFRQVLPLQKLNKLYEN